MKIKLSTLFLFFVLKVANANAALTDDPSMNSLKAQHMAANLIHIANRQEAPTDRTDNPFFMSSYCLDLGGASAAIYGLRLTQGIDFHPLFSPNTNVAQLSAKIREKAAIYCSNSSENLLSGLEPRDWVDLAVKLIQKIYPQRSEYAQSILIPRNHNDQELGCEVDNNNSKKTLSMSFAMGFSDFFHFLAQSEVGDDQRVILLENGAKKLTIEEYKHNFRYRHFCDFN